MVMIWIPTISRHWENKFERQANFLNLNDCNMYLHIYFLFFSTYFKEPLRFFNIIMLTGFFFIKKQNKTKKALIQVFLLHYDEILMMRFQNLLGATISLDSKKPVHTVTSWDCRQIVIRARITQPDNQKRSAYTTCSLGLCPLFVTFKSSKQTLYKEHNLIFRDLFFWRLSATVRKKLTLCEHTR